MRTATYERMGPVDTAAQALRIEGLRYLRVLERGDLVRERELNPEEIGQLAPLLERAWREPHPEGIAPTAGGSEGISVTFGFEDEAIPRLRLLTPALPASGA